MAELQRLEWSEIDLNRGFITVAAHKAKTRQRRLVLIADNLKEWLKPCAKANGPVCVHQRPQMAVARLCEAMLISFSAFVTICQGISDPGLRART
jgi:integrase